MLKKLPFMLLLVGPVLAGGCFISADDDNGRGACDCEDTHTTCVAKCNDDASCIAVCDTNRDDCKKGC